MGAYVAALRALQDAAKRRDREAVLALVTADVEYHYHVGSPPLHGAEKLAKFLDRYFARFRDTEWVVERCAETDDALLAEGWESYTDADTGKRVTNRYMGSMVFRDGKIAVWKDYFQMGPPPGGGPGSQTAAGG